MWIRSQNKKALFRATEIIAYRDEQDGKYKIGYDGWDLGEYSTEDQVMRIMDEIQIKINTEFCVFQMPEDETE